MPVDRSTPLRPIHEIAGEIYANWENVYFGAVPYLQAMEVLIAPDQMYLQDRADDIIRRFLVNAKSWRGETARRVKAELREMIK